MVTPTQAVIQTLRDRLDRMRRTSSRRRLADELDDIRETGKSYIALVFDCAFRGSGAVVLLLPNH